MYLGSMNTCQCPTCRFSRDIEERAKVYFNSCPFRVIPEEFIYSFVNSIRHVYPQKAYQVLLQYANEVRLNINDERGLLDV